MEQVQHAHMVEQNSTKLEEPATAKWVPKAKPKGDLKKILLSEGSLTKTIVISADLTPEAEDTIVDVLWKNEDIFAWGPEDIPVVARPTIEHKPVVTTNVQSKKQKLRHTYPKLTFFCDRREYVFFHSNCSQRVRPITNDHYALPGKFGKERK